MLEPFTNYTQHQGKAAKVRGSLAGEGGGNTGLPKGKGDPAGSVSAEMIVIKLNGEESWADRRTRF